MSDTQGADAERGGDSGPHNGGDCRCWCEGDTYESEGATFCALCNHEMPRPAPLAEPDTGDAQPATQRCWKELGRSDTQAHLVAVCAKPEGHEGECSNVLPKPGGSR